MPFVGPDQPDGILIWEYPPWPVCTKARTLSQSTVQVDRERKYETGMNGRVNVAHTKVKQSRNRNGGEEEEPKDVSCFIVDTRAHLFRRCCSYPSACFPGRRVADDDDAGANGARLVDMQMLGWFGCFREMGWHGMGHPRLAK